MSLPREVVPGRFYLITRRCTQRMFLLRPDPETNRAFLYCLALASTRFEVDVLMTCAMSNHHHTVIYDRHGNYPEFLELFHKLVARSQNALRGRFENFWASGQTSVVLLVDADAVIREMVYVATNPVNDHLVDRAHHWPGVNTFVAFCKGESIKVERPRHFFRSNGPLPDSATLTLVVPSAWGAREDVVRDVAKRVEQVESRCEELRRTTGVRVAGRNAIRRTSWRYSPDTVEVRRGLNPRVASRDPESRIAAILQMRDFVSAYRAARQRWLFDGVAQFPAGTYWLRRFARIDKPHVPPTSLN